MGLAGGPNPLASQDTCILACREIEGKRSIQPDEIAVRIDAVRLARLYDGVQGYRVFFLKQRVSRDVDPRDIQYASDKDLDESILAKEDVSIR